MLLSIPAAHVQLEDFLPESLASSGLESESDITVREKSNGKEKSNSVHACLDQL